MADRLKSVIIEDVSVAAEQLRRKILEHCPNLEVSGMASNVVEGLKLIRNAKPDIVFLDVEMGESDGFDLLDLWPENEEKQVIFTTGSKEYAIKAIRYKASDYLLKPVDPEDLKLAVERAIENMAEGAQISTGGQNGGRLPLHTAESIEYVDIEKILYIEADGNYSSFFLEDGRKIVVSNTLKVFDEKLAEKGFLRVHQSHLVNMKHVLSYLRQDGGYVKMSSGKLVPVSFRKRALVLQMLDQYH